MNVKQNIYAFNFINFVEYYKENLRALINREQEDDREIFTKTNMREKWRKKRMRRLMRKRKKMRAKHK